MSKVKARDLRPGTVVMLTGYSRPGREVVVTTCDRVADLVEPARAAVAKAKSRTAMMAAAESLVAILDDLDSHGREARRVTVECAQTGTIGPMVMESGRELEWRGQR